MGGSRTVNDYLTAAYAEQARAEKLTEGDTRNPDRTALVWAVSSVSSALQAIAVAISEGGVRRDEFADGGFVRDGSKGWSDPKSDPLADERALFDMIEKAGGPEKVGAELFGKGWDPARGRLWNGPPILSERHSYNVCLRGVDDEACSFDVSARSSAEAGEMGMELAEESFPKMEWEVDTIEAVR